MKFTAKKRRSRWKNCINPILSKNYLTNAEELVIIAYHYSYKNQWSRIARYLSHRHNNILRNSFHGIIKKLVKSIINTKPLPLKVTGLELLQSLYIGTYLIDLIEIKVKPIGKNSIVPLYIYKHVQESSIGKER